MHSSNSMATMTAHRFVPGLVFPRRRTLRYYHLSSKSGAQHHDEPEGKPKELIVVRHGETEWNRELRVQGVTDVPLNAKGVSQAEASAKTLLRDLRVFKPGAIHSSNMRRASDTAQAIADALNESSASDDDKVAVSKHRELNEWNLGVLEGMQRDEASARYPEEWKVFSEWADPLVSKEHAETSILGGESMEDVRSRAVGCLSKLLETSTASTRETAPVVVVTHGGVLGQLLRHALVAQYPVDKRDELRRHSNMEDIISKYPRPKNACITRFTIHPTTLEWSISDWASVSHLVGDAAPMDTNYKGSGR